MLSTWRFHEMVNPTPAEYSCKTQTLKDWNLCLTECCYSSISNMHQSNKVFEKKTWKKKISSPILLMTKVPANYWKGLNPLTLHLRFKYRRQQLYYRWKQQSCRVIEISTVVSGDLGCSCSWPQHLSGDTMWSINRISQKWNLRVSIDIDRLIFNFFFLNIYLFFYYAI